MIIGIHGYLGSFKTTTAVALAKLSYDNGYTVMSNQPLNFPYVKLDMDMIRRYAIIGEQLPYEKLFILGDEWQQVMDSRRSMDGDELMNTYFIAQTRKRGVKLCYIAPQRGMSDLRLRENTNVIFKCYKRHKETKKICFNDECDRPHYAEWYIINVQAGKGKHCYLKNPEVVYSLFDTHHIISPISHLSENEMKQIITAIKTGFKT
jgi:hypothetical protein